MTGIDLLWLFFIFIGLQPILKKKMLEAARQKMIAKIEKQRGGSRVIILIHRQETMSILGFPLMRFIDINDSEQVIRAIHLTDSDTPIDIILHTPGGLLLASLQIARAIEKHKAKVTAYVPHYAMSGGTLIALAADEIVMDDHAVLGPLDPQIGNFSAASLVRVFKKKTLEHVDDETLILADSAEKALYQIKNEIIDLLSDRYSSEKAEFIADTLSQGHWTHDHPISVKEAIKIGLPIKKDIPKEIYQLMELFPQPVRYQPSVEFLPIPKHSPKRPGTNNFYNT